MNRKFLYYFFNSPLDRKSAKRGIPCKYFIICVQSLTESCTELQGQLVLIEHEGAKEMEELEKHLLSLIEELKSASEAKSLENIELKEDLDYEKSVSESLRNDLEVKSFPRIFLRLFFCLR